MSRVRGLNSLFFSAFQKSGPAMTELEMATLDWLVDVLGVPEHFKVSSCKSQTLVEHKLFI